MKFVQIKRRFEVFEKEGGGGGDHRRLGHIIVTEIMMNSSRRARRSSFPLPPLICRLSCPSIRPSLPPIPNTSTDLNHHSVCRSLAIEVTLLMHRGIAFANPRHSSYRKKQYGDELFAYLIGHDAHLPIPMLVESRGAAKVKFAHRLTEAWGIGSSLCPTFLPPSRHS